MKRVELTPTLIIGVGGIGGKTINTIKGLVQERTGVKNFPAIKFLYIDSTLEDYKTFPYKHLDANEEFINVSFDTNEMKVLFEKPETYKISRGEGSLAEIITEWYKKYFKENVDVREIIGGCGGLPIVCRVSFIRNHFGKVADEIEKALKTLNNPDQLNLNLTQNFGDRFAILKEEKGGVKINVYIILSLGGGTGRGLYEQVNVLIKAVARKLGLNFNQVKTRFFVILPPQMADISLPKYSYINTYAGFKEINVFQEKKYKTEHYIIELYKLNGLIGIEDIVEKEGLADQICLVSSVFENGDIITKSFDEFIVRFSRFIVDSIFDGFQNTLLSRESNLENILSKAPKIFDIEGRKERGRHYSRLMYSSLYFPYENTIDFISSYAMKVILEDIRLGSLPSREKSLHREVLKEDIKAVSLKTLDSLNLAKENIRNKIESIPSEINDIDVINQIMKDIDFISEVLNRLKINLNELMQLEEAIKEKLRSNFNMDSKLINNIKTYISDHGGIQGFINLLDDIIEDFLEEQLKYTKHLTTIELVKLLEDESEYRKTVEKVIEKINEVQSYLYGISNELEGVKSSSEAGLKKIVKFIFKEIDEETKEKAKAIVSSLKSEVQKFTDDLEKEIENLASFVVYRFLKTLMENFKVKSDIIKSLEKGIEADLNEAVSDVREGYKKLFLNNRSEGVRAYRFYNKYFKFKDSKNESLEEKYDMRLKQKHIYNNIASFTFNFDTFREELLTVINSFKEEIKEGFKKEFPDGLSFLDKMLDPSSGIFLGDDKNIVSDIQASIKQWIKNEDFWGVIDTSKAENSEVINQKDTKFVTMIMPKKYEHIMETVRNTLGDLTIDFREAPDKDAVKDTIKVMGVHYGLPLFIFNELHSMKTLYIKEKKDIRPKYHIAEWFVYEEEPLGESYGAVAEDLKYLLILAYVLGAIRGNLEDPADIIEVFSFISNFSLQCKYKPLEVKSSSKSIIRTKKDIKRLSPYDRYVILDQIKNAIIERYIYLVDKYKEDEQERDALKLFLSPRSYDYAEKYKLIIPMKEGLRMLLKQKLDEYEKRNFRLDLVSLIRNWLDETEEEYMDYSFIDNEIKKYESFKDVDKVCRIYKPKEDECA